MSAVECLEHKWLNEYSLTTLLPSTIIDNDITLTDCRTDTIINYNKPASRTSPITTTAQPTTILNGTHLRNLKHPSTENDSTPTLMASNGTILNALLHDDHHKTNATCNDYANKENIVENRNICNLLCNITNGSSIAANGTSNTSCILEFVDETTTTAAATATAPTPTTPTTATKHQPSLFPDSPTTPKVFRKSSPDSPPSVKTLVKKFQLDSIDRNVVCGSSKSIVVIDNSIVC